MMTTLRGCASPVAVLALLLGVPQLAECQVMPDPKEIAGIPLPVGDVPAGTVTVRVIRGALSNNISGQPVELFVDGAARRQNTGESGRVEFSGLPAGARVKAVAVVPGPPVERLESQEFAVPAAGGIRLLLVASDPERATRDDEDRRLAAGPALPGAVVLGEESRFVIEVADRALNVFSILQIVNTARTPVEPREPIVFESAASGGNVSVLNGSSPRAKAEGRRITVAGPFPPGPTLVQFAYSVPYSGPSVTIEQRLPVPLSQVTVMAQKLGEMHVTSPHISQRREVSAQGDVYIVGQGPGVRAGGTLSFSFEGLPHAAVWPRDLALALAGLILAGGIWSSVGTRATPAPEAGRAALEARRDRLFSELTAIERQRAGSTDPRQHAASLDRRRELLTELESVYAALDH